MESKYRHKTLYVQGDVKLHRLEGIFSHDAARVITNVSTLHIPTHFKGSIFLKDLFLSKIGLIN